MKLSIVVAMDSNRAIGDSNDLLWKNELPVDLRRFREITFGHPVIMGRKTHESIGRALPGRQNIVLTRDRSFQANGCIVVHSLQDSMDEALKYGTEIMIIGGSEIYRQFLPRIQKIYLTIVHGVFNADTFFPELDWDGWNILSEKDFEPDEKNLYPYSFLELERK